MGLIISGLGRWPGIPNTAGQNIFLPQKVSQKLQRTIRGVLLRAARLATLLAACELRSLRPE
jgi:hypothetical protein